VTSTAILAAATFSLPALGAVATLVLPDRDQADDVARAIAALTGLAALALAAAAFGDPARVERAGWIVVDVAGALLVGVVGFVGVVATVASPAYLTASGREARGYYPALFAFWALLAAVPLAASLGVAWLLVEATTAASALLVAHSAKPRALEAGWKYLVLTSLGLAIALLGIVVLETAGVSGLSWSALASSSTTIDHDSAVLAAVLLIGGLAAKVGWAPVHNWLPDAHSEAPAPVSAMLSAALLPTVLLVAWRVDHALAPAAGQAAGRLLVAFGLVSVAVAVPFLWRPMAWKRLLAYSSLEHMGVIALGVGFGSDLALAGAAIHIAGHAVAKSLGFLAATPLLADQPAAAHHVPTGIARSRPALGAALGLSLAALAGLPPSPLFVSEVLVIAGGFAVGDGVAAAAAAVFLALGFLGLAHALIELLAGRERPRHSAAPPGLRGVVVLAGLAAVTLLAIALTGIVLPGSDLVAALERGIG
jgi:hydrogenase-4 component F